MDATISAGPYNDFPTSLFGSMPQVALRRATPKDVPTIIHMLRALAQYENTESAVQTTELRLLHTLSLGQIVTAPLQNLASAILLFENDNPVGLCLYFTTFSSRRGTGGIWIEDLFVREECRGRGYGTRLMAECAKELLEKHSAGGRLEWSVKAWNMPTIAFYERQGAVPLHDQVRMRMQGAALEKLAGLGRGLEER